MVANGKTLPAACCLSRDRRGDNVVRRRVFPFAAMGRFYDRVSGFQAMSSCRAALTSSSRRTGR